MKVLVTGCHGFIGHHVCRLLMERGHTVVGMDRLVDPRSPKAERVRAMAGTGLKFVEGNIASLTRCREVVTGANFDVIVHLAGQFPIRHTVQNVGAYVDSNVKGWLNVAEAAVAAKVRRIVYASTVAVSDKGTPGSMYGATKMFGEHAAHVYSKLGPEMVGLRFGPTYGPMMRADAGLYKALVGQFKRHVDNSRTFHQLHPLIYISDAAETVLRFAEAKTLPAKHSVHLVAADDWLADFGHAIALAAPFLGVSGLYPSGYIHRERTERPDLTSLDRFIQWRPFTSLDLGIRPTADWLLEERRKAA